MFPALEIRVACVDTHFAFFFLIEKLRFGICTEDEMTPVSEFIAVFMILSASVFVCK